MNDRQGKKDKTEDARMELRIKTLLIVLTVNPCEDLNGEV